MSVQESKMEYLFEQTKALIEYFKSKKHRWTEILKLEIDKVINVRKSLIEMNQILINDNLKDSIASLDKYLIDLEYLKKYDADIGVPIEYENYKDVFVKGKKKNINLVTNYEYSNKMNHTMIVNTLVEYKNKISEREIIGLLREILLRLNFDEKLVDTRIKEHFNINNKKFENIKYKIIYANGSFLSLPLQELKTELDYDIFIATMESKYPNGPLKETLTIYPQQTDYSNLESILFKHHITGGDYIFTADMKDYYDKLS